VIHGFDLIHLFICQKPVILRIVSVLNNLLISLLFVQEEWRIQSLENLLLGKEKIDAIGLARTLLADPQMGKEGSSFI
jgi:hypothetical protein